MPFFCFVFWPQRPQVFNGDTVRSDRTTLREGQLKSSNATRLRDGASMWLQLEAVSGLLLTILFISAVNVVLIKTRTTDTKTTKRACLL